MINQAPIVRYTAFVCEIFFSDFRKKTFSAESNITPDPNSKLLTCSFCGKNQNEVRKLIAGPSVHICDECVELCDDIVSEEVETHSGAKAKPEGGEKQSREDRLCGICKEPRETDELIFLPHAAYICAGCLEDIQMVRDKQAEK